MQILQEYLKQKYTNQSDNMWEIKYINDKRGS